MADKTFYCIIQGRDSSNDWWKQIIKDVIYAEDKKQAREIVKENYLKNIPMRMKRKDIKEDSLLLSLYEIDGNSYFKKDYFDPKKCEICGSKFTMIDKYNLFESFGCEEHCSPKCTKKYNENNFVKSDYEHFNYCESVIYMITQISTGKKYIGKTERSFTLRWWEHIKSKAKDKFHLVLAESPIEDFIFQVVEVVPKDRLKDILTIEQEWIRKHNTIEEGFNTMGESKDKVAERLQGELNI